MFYLLPFNRDEGPPDRGPVWFTLHPSRAQDLISRPEGTAVGTPQEGPGFSSPTTPLRLPPSTGLSDLGLPGLSQMGYTLPVRLPCVTCDFRRPSGRLRSHDSSVVELLPRRTLVPVVARGTYRCRASLPPRRGL